jgi:GAF domain-containing protein/anti-anti-sigma regulatory factor
MREVTIAATTVQQAVVLRLSGALTRATAAETTRALVDTTTRLPSPSLLVLDMRDVEQLSAGGLAAVRAFVDAQAANGVRCSLLVTPAGPIARVLDTADPGAALPRFTELEHALVGPEPHPDDDLLTDQFESLTRMLLGTKTVGEALHQVVVAATIVVTDSDLVSVTLRAPDGTLFTPESTGDPADELDQVQYRSGAGPCLDAADPAGPAYAASADLHRERRWPEFTAAATSHGFGALVSTALLPGAGSGSLSGALTIFSRRPHGLTATDRHAALLLATHASLALAHAQTTELADVRLAQFRRAVDNRDVIGQAKGILMHRQRITAQDAFALLRRTSQELNVKLVELARTVAVRHGELDRP